MTSENPMEFTVAVSALEAEIIFQMVENINRDMEVMGEGERA